MKRFLRTSVLFCLVSGSLSLLACTAGTADTGVSSAAQPLTDACTGTYTCTSEGSTETTRVSLERNAALDLCVAGDAYIEAGHNVTTDAGGHAKLGTWSGDSKAFSICASDGCLRCTADNLVAGDAGSAQPTGTTGSCTGVTDCDDYGPGDCGTHDGCSLHSHAVYSFGSFDHYENECTGSTPSCSSHTSEAECKREDCSWK